MQKSILIALSFFLFLFTASAQQIEDKDVLQQKREQLRKEIEETEKALNETKKTAKVNIGQLTLINKKVNLAIAVEFPRTGRGASSRTGCRRGARCANLRQPDSPLTIYPRSARPRGRSKGGHCHQRGQSERDLPRAAR